MKEAFDLLLFFLIPFGFGIPPGIIYGINHKLPWYEMTLIYFISDWILAAVFDPIMHAIRKSRAFAKLPAKFKTDYIKNMERFGFKPTPFSLIIFAFGSDPMTGRIATFIAGHGFFTGWCLSIAGDMIFFTMMMASTLWLNNILGDGTAAAVIVLFVFLIVPALWRRLRGSSNQLSTKN